MEYLEEPTARRGYQRAETDSGNRAADGPAVFFHVVFSSSSHCTAYDRAAELAAPHQAAEGSEGRRRKPEAMKYLGASAPRPTRRTTIPELIRR